MMEYKELSKLYHMDCSASRDSSIQAELQSRITAESTFRTGFYTPNGELFIATPRELSLLNEHVLKTERRISSLLDELPTIARKAVLRSMVIDEVVSTNAIEAVSSTRRQIKDALDSVSENDSNAKRFKELAMLYLSIIDNNDALPKTPEDIRAIYDRITAGEIPCDKLPDGELFRKEGVDITAGGLRVLHHGLTPESKIFEAMQKMIALIKDESIPSIYRAIASHYIFEYVHPFYDGNGRTGRYLLSLSLSQSLSLATVLSLSKSISENKDSYYRAFKTVEDKLNYAELTFFIYLMLDLIKKAQLEVIDKLKASIYSLDYLKSKLDVIASRAGLKGKEKAIVFLLLQHEALGLFGDVTLQESADYLLISKQQARKYLSRLEEKGVCQIINSYNPITFKLQDEFKARYVDA